jgi:hypothetical protein
VSRRWRQLFPRAFLDIAGGLIADRLALLGMCVIDSLAVGTPLALQRAAAPDTAGGYATMADTTCRTVTPTSWPMAIEAMLVDPTGSAGEPHRVFPRKINARKFTGQKRVMNSTNLSAPKCRRISSASLIDTTLRI